MKKFLKFITALFFIGCNSQIEFDLDKILQNEKSDLIIIEIYDYLNKKSEYGKNIEELNYSQKIFLFIENLEGEVNNGGFNQFYFNSSGDYSQETINALIEVGAIKTVEIVKKANSEFNLGIVPKDRTERQNELEKIESMAEKTWRECDSKFYEYQDNLTELLIAFVINNKADFKN